MALNGVSWIYKVLMEILIGIELWIVLALLDNHIGKVEAVFNIVMHLFFNAVKLLLLLYLELIVINQTFFYNPKIWNYAWVECSAKVSDIIHAFPALDTFEEAQVRDNHSRCSRHA
jgi:hypothetical protein